MCRLALALETNKLFGYRHEHSLRSESDSEMSEKFTILILF